MYVPLWNNLGLQPVSGQQYHAQSPQTGRVMFLLLMRNEHITYTKTKLINIPMASFAVDFDLPEVATSPAKPRIYLASDSLCTACEG